VGEIVHLKPEPETVGRSLSGQAMCLVCKHTWVAVVDVEKDSYEGDLECPSCGVQRGQFTWPFTGPPEEVVWHCGCGGVVFMITMPGTRCVNCGRHQAFNG